MEILVVSFVLACVVVKLIQAALNAVGNFFIWLGRK